MTPYSVKQGDCISSIAHQQGFSWQTLWNHPANAGLKERRGNPNALLPGDVVQIPEKQRREEPCSPTRLHRFRIKGAPVHFNLRVLDGIDRPRAEIPYTLMIDGASRSGNTDTEGCISEIIQPDARRAKLTLNPSAERPEVYEFNLGYMNPVDDIAGLQARLQNLGYLERVTGKMDRATTDGLRKFQHAAELEPTGKLDEGTRSALEAAYGG